MSTWTTLLRTRPGFRRLWLSGTISLLGDWLSLVAVSIATLRRGGGATGLAVVFALHALPGALFSPAAGVLADRMDRVRLLRAANLIQAALTVALVPATLAGVIPAMQLLLFVRSAVAALVVPAESAALRHVVAPNELLPANALMAGTWSVTYCVGMALGGALMALGPGVALTLDALSFVAAAAVLRGLPPIAPSETSPLVAALSGTVADIARAWRHAAARVDLRSAVLAKAPVALASGGAWVTLNLVAHQRAPLGTAALSLGILQAVRGFGTGAGPLAADALERRRGDRGLRAGSVALTYVAAGAFALSGHPVALLVTALLWGAGAGANWVLSTADVQRLSADDYVGRLTAVDNVATTAAFVATALLGGVIADATGSRLLPAVAGIALALLVSGALAASARRSAGSSAAVRAAAEAG